MDWTWMRKPHARLQSVCQGRCGRGVLLRETTERQQSRGAPGEFDSLNWTPLPPPIQFFIPNWMYKINSQILKHFLGNAFYLTSLSVSWVFSEYSHLYSANESWVHTCMWLHSWDLYVLAPLSSLVPGPCIYHQQSLSWIICVILYHRWETFVYHEELPGCGSIGDSLRIKRSRSIGHSEVITNHSKQTGRACLRLHPGAFLLCCSLLKH